MVRIKRFHESDEKIIGSRPLCSEPEFVGKETGHLFMKKLIDLPVLINSFIDAASPLQRGKKFRIGGSYFLETIFLAADSASCNFFHLVGKHVK